MSGWAPTKFFLPSSSDPSPNAAQTLKRAGTPLAPTRAHVHSLSCCGCCAQYSLTEDLAAGSTLNLDLKVDRLLPLKASCPMCGGNCSINIPVVKQNISFAMPACPIKKGSGASIVRRSCVNHVCADDIRDYLTTHAMLCVWRVQLRREYMSAGNSTQLTLPADPLQKGKVSIDGSISVTDQNQALVASVELQLALE